MCACEEGVAIGDRGGMGIKGVKTNREIIIIIIIMKVFEGSCNRL